MARRVSSRPFAASPDASSARGARSARPDRPILCAVLDGDALGRDPRAQAISLFAAGVDWIQLRDRAREGRALLEVAHALVAARDAARAADGAHAGVRVIVNKRLDIALAAGADGVHLGVDAVPADSAAALLAEAATPLIGASLHGLAELEDALDRSLPLTYVHLAPIWDPRSKPVERPALGISVLAAAAARAQRVGLRVLAQGGLDAERARAAMAAGAAGIAVTGGLGRGGTAARAARALRTALDEARDGKHDAEPGDAEGPGIAAKAVR